jgi:hypothetical protein
LASAATHKTTPIYPIVPCRASAVLPPGREAFWSVVLSHRNRGAPDKIRTCDLCLRRATVVASASGTRCGRRQLVCRPTDLAANCVQQNVQHREGGGWPATWHNYHNFAHSRLSERATDASGRANKSPRLPAHVDVLSRDGRRSFDTAPDI